MTKGELFTWIDSFFIEYTTPDIKEDGETIMDSGNTVQHWEFIGLSLSENGTPQLRKHEFFVVDAGDGDNNEAFIAPHFDFRDKVNAFIADNIGQGGIYAAGIEIINTEQKNAIVWAAKVVASVQSVDRYHCYIDGVGDLAYQLINPTYVNEKVN